MSLPVYANTGLLLLAITGLCHYWSMPLLVYAITGLSLLAITGLCYYWSMSLLVYAITGLCYYWSMSLLAYVITGRCHYWSISIYECRSAHVHFSFFFCFCFFCFASLLRFALFYSVLGCVLPLQEVALRQSLPTFSVLCYPCPYSSLLPHNVISPTTFWSSG